MADTKYIAVDLGAESGRVMLGTLSASGIALVEVHRFPNISVRVGNTLHWDMLRLWHEAQVGINKIAAEHEVAGIGVDTWGVDFGLLDAKGELLGNPVCYRDTRTDGMIDAVFGRLSKEKIYGLAGIQTMSLNTLFQMASLSFNNSPQLQATKHILFLPDLLTYWLSGVMGTDYTIASTAQMLDARSREWSTEVLNMLGISGTLFPPISIPGESRGAKNSIRGTVLPSVNAKLAAAKVPVIAVGGHDTASAVAAVPALGSGDWLYLSSGTWSIIGAEVDQPVLTEIAAANNVSNEGGVGGKIRLQKNLSGLWLLQECKRAWARQGTDYDYATLTSMAEKAAPLTAILDVEDPTFFTPGDMPEKIAAHCRSRGLIPPTTPGQTARVILESLAFGYGKLIRMMEQITGKTFKTLHIVGGGSQNNLLNQMAADATGLPVLAGPVEATAIGNIMTQAITTGALPSIAAGRALVAKSIGARPFMPTNMEKWKQLAR